MYKHCKILDLQSRTGAY